MKLNFRNAKIETKDKDSREILISFSSDTPVNRGDYDEILLHRAENINLDYLNRSAPLLLDHDQSQLIGKVKRAYIEEGKGYAVVVFSRNAKAEEVFLDVADGIRENVSVTYTIEQQRSIETSNNNKTRTLVEVSKWTPREISFVSIPADDSVGVNRSFNLKEQEMTEKEQQNEQVKIKQDDIASRNSMLQDERMRSEEILSIASHHSNLKDINEMARSFINSGRSVDMFRSLVLDERSKEQITKAREADFEVPKEEFRGFNFSHLLGAIINDDTPSRNLAMRELEICNEYRKRHNITSAGFYIPYDVMAQRFMASSSSGMYTRDYTSRDHASRGYISRDFVNTGADSAGSLIKTSLLTNQFLNMVRQKRLFMQKATFWNGLNGVLDVPFQTEKTTSYWVGEAQDATISNWKSGKKQMTPKKAKTLVAITENQIKQSSIDIERTIYNDMLDGILDQIELAAIRGSGSSNQPKGIIPSLAAAMKMTYSSDLTWDVIVNALKKLEDAGETDEHSSVFIASNDVKWDLKKTYKNSSLPDGTTPIAVPVWSNDSRIDDYPATKSAFLNSGEFIVGDLSQLIIGLWGGIVLKRESKIINDTYLLAASQELDITLRRNNSLVYTKKVNSK